MPSSPMMPGSTTNSASPEKICSSALTTSTWIVLAMRLLQRLCFFELSVDAAQHVERLLRQMIAFAVDDHVEAADRLLERHELARRVGEHFSDEERLRQEALHLACTRHRQLVLRRELVHAQDGNDVAQLLVAL